MSDTQSDASSDDVRRNKKRESQAAKRRSQGTPERPLAECGTTGAYRRHIRHQKNGVKLVPLVADGEPVLSDKGEPVLVLRPDGGVPEEICDPCKAAWAAFFRAKRAAKKAASGTDTDE